jgi:hypothetical protein
MGAKERGGVTIPKGTRASEVTLDIPRHGATPEVIDAVRQIYEDNTEFPSYEINRTITKKDIYRILLGTDARKGRVEVMDGKKVRRGGYYNNKRYKHIPHRLIDGTLNNWIYVLAQSDPSTLSNIGSLVIADLEELKIRYKKINP